MNTSFASSRVVHVLHHTEYRYEAPVSQSWQLAHLRPRATARQRVHAHRLVVAPTPDWIDARTDAFGNGTTAFAIHAAHDRLDVIAESRVEVAAPAHDTVAALRPWDPQSVAAATGREALELASFVGPSPLVPRSRRAVHYGARSFRPGVPFVAALDELAHRIHRDFEFDASATTVTTPLETVFAERRGVCQDFAQLMIACLRGVGVPARYVSGYILTKPPPGKPRLIGADASHAWVSAWCPGQGWIDVDPTNDRRVDQDFVTLGWGRDFSDVTPLRGVILGGGAQVLAARVTVTPEDVVAPH
ncbi:MAG: transglutaminase family protein [Burkholderiales bacterium]|jgi:transglutaminase-like putative cysteine protease